MNSPVLRLNWKRTLREAAPAFVSQALVEIALTILTRLARRNRAVAVGTCPITALAGVVLFEGFVVI